MKKILILTLAVIVLITSIFTACSKKDDGSSTEGLENSDNDYGFETEAVTDEDGNEVTDENGDVVTTEIAVKYEGGKAYKLDDNGEKVTDSKGKYVTVKYDKSSTGTGSTTRTVDESATLATNPKKDETATTKKNIPMTSSSQTTAFNATEVVPSTSATGTEVSFSEDDQLIIKSMLEVPYLYLSSYENSDGVPIDIACHVAVWMAEHEGSTRTVYPSSPVVLNLFKYFGQTVVNFKSKCNDYSTSAKAPIHYNSTDDTFEISEFTPKVQSVTITKIEDLGNNNFYKITASVTGCSKKKVIAVVQKNRLDVTLGFSIKALKWS